MRELSENYEESEKKMKMFAEKEQREQIEQNEISSKKGGA